MNKYPIESSLSRTVDPTALTNPVLARPQLPTLSSLDSLTSAASESTVISPPLTTSTPYPFQSYHHVNSSFSSQLNPPLQLFTPCMLSNQSHQHLVHAISALTQWNPGTHNTTARLNHLAYLLHSYRQHQVGVANQQEVLLPDQPPITLQRPIPPPPPPSIPLLSKSACYSQSEKQQPTSSRYFGKEFFQENDFGTVMPSSSSVSQSDARSMSPTELFHLDSFGTTTNESIQRSTYRSIEWRPSPPSEKVIGTDKMNSSEDATTNPEILTLSSFSKGSLVSSQGSYQSTCRKRSALFGNKKDQEDGECFNEIDICGDPNYSFSRETISGMKWMARSLDAEKESEPNVKRRRPLLSNDDLMGNRRIGICEKLSMNKGGSIITSMHEKGDSEGESENITISIDESDESGENIEKKENKSLEMPVETTLRLEDSSALQHETIELEATAEQDVRRELRDEKEVHLTQRLKNQCRAEHSRKQTPKASLEVISSVSTMNSSDITEESEPEDGAATPEELIPTSIALESIVRSIKSLKQEEIDRELTWSLWELQEALGSNFPSCLKPICEPPLSIRPLHAFRYTAAEANRRPKVASDFWSSKTEICDMFGNIVISRDALSSIRTTFECPTVVPSSPPTPTEEDSQSIITGRSETKLDCCRLCGSIECEAKFIRGGCRRARCARCCHQGHNARRCRQSNPNLWNCRYLHCLDVSYKESLGARMFSTSDTTNECNGIKPTCITCGKRGHSCCQFNPDTPTMSFLCARKGERFRIIARETILRDMEEVTGHRSIGIRWDHEASLFHQDLTSSQMPTSRYSIRDWLTSPEPSRQSEDKDTVNHHSINGRHGYYSQNNSSISSSDHRYHEGRYSRISIPIHHNSLQQCDGHHNYDGPDGPAFHSRLTGYNPYERYL